MEVKDALARARAISQEIEARGWHGRCSVVLNWSREEVTVHVGVGPARNAGEHLRRAASDKSVFYSGELAELRDLLGQARSYVANLDGPEQAQLEDVVRQLASAAETAEAYGLQGTQREAWDALAAYLRKASQQLAERGLPRPDQFHTEPLASEEGR